MGRRDMFLKLAVFFDRLAASCSNAESKACYKLEAARYARKAHQPLGQIMSAFRRNHPRIKTIRPKSGPRPKPAAETAVHA
jgi:hypothetical protein